jgi:TrmH family RNA methyltransferase
VISSAANSRLKLVRRLQTRRGRESLGLFVCEGEDLVAAGLDAGLEPVEALLDGERPVLAERLPAAELVDPRLIATLSELGHPARIIAVFRRDDLPRLDPAKAAPVGLALWRLGDPGNVGTLLRTADGLGPAFVCLSAGCADPTSSKALRASAGAIFRVPLGRFDEVPGSLIALVPAGGATLAEADLGGPVTFALGSERQGLPADIVAGCHSVATIPQVAGAESLNVAAAGAIALYEWRRRQ